MISHAHLSNRFWAEAVATATYLRNRSSTTALEEETTPHERWYDRKPNLELRVWLMQIVTEGSWMRKLRSFGLLDIARTQKV